MSRVALVFAASALAATVAGPAFAGEPALNSFGLPIAPQGGNTSIHQWGGIDDTFAVNPDGDEAPVRPHHGHANALAQNQDDDADGDDPGDPDADHENEILPI
jgi:hypothetical protein